VDLSSDYILITLTPAVNYFNCSLMHHFDRSIYVVCCRQWTTTRLIYKMSSNNFISLST